MRIIDVYVYSFFLFLFHFRIKIHFLFYVLPVHLFFLLQLTHHLSAIQLLKKTLG